ncbi:amyloid fiber anchoring/assembly protein TapA [Lentibacillus halodurans]|nr:amyloid fiber anchoring/assembly protein TapA [Lentibacillus halodurans]
MSRLRKFNRNKKMIVACKILVICYLLIFTLGYLTSGTGAYFNSSEEDQQVIQAGTWWDGSELVFVGNNTQNIKACPPEEITVDIKNRGFSMIDSTEYGVYYVENGNPKNNGEKIADGMIESMEEGETKSLTFEAEQKGSYMFTISQHPEYDGDNQNPWSKKMMVKCIENNEKTEQEEDKQNAKSEEAENKNDQEHDGNNNEDTDNKTDEQANDDQGEKTDNKDNQVTDKQQPDDQSHQENKEEDTPKDGSKQIDKTNDHNAESEARDKAINDTSEKKGSGEGETDEQNE